MSKGLVGGGARWTYWIGSGGDVIRPVLIGRGEFGLTTLGIVIIFPIGGFWNPQNFWLAGQCHVTITAPLLAGGDHVATSR